MKKIFAVLLAGAIMGLNACVYAEVSENEPPLQNSKNELIKHDDAPKWEEYVAPKCRNPRTDFTRGASVTELVCGIILTELILTAPIGIPMTIHGTTKVKMVSYNNRKNIFDREIEKAQYIADDSERAEAYKKILKRCHLKESTRLHYAQKEAKAKAKAEKKAAKKARE